MLHIATNNNTTHLPYVLGNAVESQAGLVGDNVEIFTDPLTGFLDLSKKKDDLSLHIN